MLPQLLLASHLSEELLESFRVWPSRVEEGQEVPVVCSSSTACAVLTYADLMMGPQHVAAVVDPLLSWRIGVVFLVSDDLTSNTDEIQLLLLRMGLKPFPVLSLDQATAAAERMRKLGNHFEEDRPCKRRASEPAVEALAQIDQLNARRAVALLDKFGSVQAVANVTSTNDLMQVKGFGNNVASSVVGFFEGSS